MSNPVMYGVGGILLEATIDSAVDKYKITIRDIVDEIQDHMSRQGFNEVYTAEVENYIFDALQDAGF